MAGKSSEEVTSSSSTSSLRQECHLLQHLPFPKTRALNILCLMLAGNICTSTVQCMHPLPTDVKGATCCKQSIQLLQAVLFHGPSSVHMTGIHMYCDRRKDQDAWKGAYQKQAVVTTGLVPTTIPEGFRKTSQTSCPDGPQAFISIMAKVGGDSQLFFSAPPLHPSPSAERTQQKYFFWCTGNTSISYWQRNTRVYSHSKLPLPP